MEDCRLALTVKNGRVLLEGEKLSLVELTELCGALQIITGNAALKHGADMDTVKDNMLDVHLAAMRILEDRNG